MSFRSKIKIAVVTLVLALGVYGFTHASTATQFSYSTESFLNQSGNMAATTLFTPVVDGNYQVTVAVEFIHPCCVSGDNNNVNPVLTWSDNTKSYSANATTTNGGPSVSAGNAITVPMRVAAGSPVQMTISTNNGGTTPNDSYNIFVTVIGN